MLRKQSDNLEVAWTTPLYTHTHTLNWIYHHKAKHIINKNKIIFNRSSAAMVQIQKLTAQTLLGASRRGPAVPNASGTLALYSHSVHDFDKNKTTKEVRVIDIRTGHSVTISNDEKVHDVLWIPDVKQKDQEADIDTDTDTDSNHHHQPDVDSHTSNDIVFLKSGDKGRTQVVIANGADHTKDHYIAAELDAPISALKLKALDDGSVAFVVAGLVSKHGSLLNDQAVEKKTSARIFDSARVRVVSATKPPLKRTSIDFRQKCTQYLTHVSPHWLLVERAV